MDFKNQTNLDKAIKLCIIFVLFFTFNFTGIAEVLAYTVAADITSYFGTDSTCQQGETCRVEVKFKNTGDITWSYGVGASLRKPNGTIVDLPVKAKVAYSKKKPKPKVIRMAYSAARSIFPSCWIMFSVWIGIIFKFYVCGECLALMVFLQIKTKRHV